MGDMKLVFVTFYLKHFTYKWVANAILIAINELEIFLIFFYILPFYKDRYENAV